MNKELDQVTNNLISLRKTIEQFLAWNREHPGEGQDLENMLELTAYTLQSSCDKLDAICSGKMR